MIPFINFPQNPLYFSLQSKLKRYVEMNRARFLHNVVRALNMSGRLHYSLNEGPEFIRSYDNEMYECQNVNLEPL